MTTNLYTRQDPAYKKALLLIILIAIASYMLKHGPQPLVPLITAEFSLTPAQGSLVVAAEMLGMSTVLLLVIILADYLDRKWLPALGLLLAAFLGFVISISPSFPLIVGLRYVQGILLGTFPALMVTYINEEFSPKLAGSLIGIYLGSTAGGGLLGRFSTTLLSGYFSWRHSFFILSLVCLVVAAAFCLWFPASRFQPAEKHLGSLHRTILPLLTNKSLLLLGWIGFTLMGTFAAIYTYITFVLMAAPYSLPKTILASIFLMQLCGSISSAVSGRLIDKWGSPVILRSSLLIMAVGSLITLGLPLACKFIGLGVFIAGVFGSHVAATSWIGRLPGVNKAPATSLYMLFYYVGGSVLSVVGGLCYHAWDWTGVILLILVCVALSLAALFQLNRTWQKNTTAA